jgi:hypothetical protein
LEKPFSPSRLAQKVRELIDKPNGHSRLSAKQNGNGNGTLDGVKH